MKVLTSKHILSARSREKLADDFVYERKCKLKTPVRSNSFTRAGPSPAASLSRQGAGLSPVPLIKSTEGGKERR